MLFILLFSEVFCQNDKDYTLYHDKILLIEQCNSREHFDSSLVLYSEVFEQYKRVMARDAYNACQIAAIKKHILFYDFFYKCAQSGIPQSRLLSNKLIQSQYLTDSKKFDSIYLQGKEDYLYRIDTALRNEMLIRAENEQKNKGKENYSLICSNNFNRIVELSKEGKFPGESLIGVSDDIESITFPTLLHYPYSYSLMKPFLEEALSNGDLTRVSLIYLYGFNQSRKSILYTSDIPADTIQFKICYNMPFGIQSNDFIEVNKQRRIKKIFSIEVQSNLRSLNSKYGLDYLIGYY